MGTKVVSPIKSGSKDSGNGGTVLFPVVAQSDPLFSSLRPVGSQYVFSRPESREPLSSCRPGRGGRDQPTLILPHSKPTR